MHKTCHPLSELDRFGFMSFYALLNQFIIIQSPLSRTVTASEGRQNKVAPPLPRLADTAASRGWMPPPSKSSMPSHAHVCSIKTQSVAGQATLVSYFISTGAERVPSPPGI
ncbi:hypothetical protein OUZ56_004894 [Daphnia magna]|uniref:Uncharacterized protein n=1 Tax=Daphnia magna TaxID=35525 RepID=A0ABQ9YR63_9CRUS|nr:hypothetical protein OUZ56_004894 [Daphnia magna]